MGKEYGDKIVSIDAYLHTTVKNRCLNYLNSKNRENNRYRDIGRDMDMDGNIDNILIEEDINFILKSAIKSLPPKTADIILLVLSGLSNKQIALTIGISINTVKTLKYSGIKKIRTFLVERDLYSIFEV